MSASKGARLNRLVRVAQLIYRREAAELARKQLDAREASEIVIDAEQRLDGPLAGGDFLAQLSVARAARARQQLANADAQVHAQLEVTMDAMSRSKGAESELDIHAMEIEKARARKDADDLQERIARPPSSSLG